MDEDMAGARGDGDRERGWESTDADAAEAFSEAASPEVDDSGNPTAASPDLSGGSAALAGGADDTPATDGGIAGAGGSDAAGELGADVASSVPLSGPMGMDEGPEFEGHPDSPGAGSRTVDDTSGGPGDEWRQSATPDEGAAGAATDYGSASSTSSTAGGTDAGPTGADASDAGASNAGAGGGRRDPAAAVAPMVAQLQAMIDNVTTQAAPVLREVAAKAAELAAAAGERAGPIAQRAAEVTQQAGQNVAARGREVAANLRQGGGTARPGGAEASAEDGGPVPGGEGADAGERPGSGTGL